MNALLPIYAEIERRSRPGAFAVFDFDNTCIVNDIGDAIFSYLCGHGLLRDRTLLGTADDSPDYYERVFNMNFALLEAGKTEAAYMLNARVFTGFSPGEAEAAALAAITEEGSRLGSKMLYGHHIERGLAPRQEIMALMGFVRERGVEPWIVSASAEPSVRAAATHFGIEANVIGVRSKLSNGVYTAEFEEPISMFGGKAECVRKYVSNEPPLLAAGDSMNDFSMLEMADIKVVVQKPGSRLSELASERKWFLL